MDLSIGILFFQESLEFYIHPPPWIGPGYRMEQPNVLGKLMHLAGYNNEYQLSFRGNS